jgi:two-component system, NtrC family, sensor histidine kinase HydH
VEEMLSPPEEGEEGVASNEQRENLIREFTELKAQVAFPISTPSSLEGLLVLGPKSSGALYSQADHVFLIALSGRIAAAWENARLFEQIQQTERLSVVGTLAASLAHEIRNPLSAISNFVQMLPERFAQDDFREKFMNTVSRELEKLTGLTNQLLSFGKPSQGMRVQVGLNALAERANQLIRFQFLKKGVGLALELWPEGELFTLGDESQLSQVALNLLLNALQATGEGGTVMVSTSRPSREWVEMKVRDTGVGMSPLQASRVFDAFFTTKSTGTGLGLAICRRVVSEHGGEIKLNSEEGRGSNFTVLLPAAENGRLVAS